MAALFVLPFALAAVPLVGAAEVGAVPPGVRSVTVLVCERTEGCPAEARALGSHLDALGLPFLTLDTVVNAGPAGGDARAAYDAAMAAVARAPTLANLEAAHAAQRALPLTLPEDAVFTLAVRLGAARLAAGNAAAADRAFTEAAQTSGGRVVNLPPVPDAALSRYLYLASADAGPGGQLQLTSDVPGVAYIDGERAGPTPLTVPLSAGWHRVTVERPGRRSAWLSELSASPELPTIAHAEIASDDGAGFLTAAVQGALRGVAPPPDAAASLARWASTQGLGWVRFVALDRAAVADHPGVPEERVTDADQVEWNLYAGWLDVGAARFVPRGPGPASLRVGGSADRLRLGAAVGYLRAEPFPGGSAHDQLAVDLTARWRLTGPWSLDGRVGVLRAAQAYYLRPGVVEHDVYPLAVGVRFGDSAVARHGGGPYVGAHALVIVPWTEGGELYAGYEFAPTWRWRLAFEARGGVTAAGVLAGAGLTFVTGG